MSLENIFLLFCALGGLASATIVRSPEILQNLIVERVSISIPVNILFLGFHREPDFRLSRETLAIWLEHVEEHVVPTPSSSVFYDFQIRVIETDKLVDSALEAALKTFMRRESIVNTTMYQVDADRMGSLFESLLHAIGSNDVYTLIVMNPDKSFLSSGKPYGYRTGFSYEEISYLHNQYKAGKQSLNLSEKSDENYPSDHDSDHEAESIKDQSENLAIDFIDVKKKSEEWASAFLIQNRELINQREKALKQSDKECDKPETIVIKDSLDRLSGPMKDEDHVRGHQINMEVMDDAGALSRHILRSGLPEDRKYLRAVFQLGPDFVHANCLVDAWIGRGRYAWLDVSAGPFSWGPSRVSGFPNRFSSNKRRNDDDDDDHGDVFRRDGGGGGDDNDGDLEMLLIYWERYCRSFYDDKEKRLRADTGDDHFEPAICRELAEKLKTKFDDDAKDDRGKAQKKEWTSVDAFLSHVASSLSAAIRHVIAPPMLQNAWTKRRAKEGLVTVKVVLFVVAEHSAYEPLDAVRGGFDVEIFTKELKKFETPNLKIIIEKYVVNATTQPGLIYHFFYALKGVLWRDGKTSVHYVDSKELEEELWSGIKSNRKIEGEKDDYVSSMQSIPVILFSLNRDDPIFIDVDLRQATTLGHVVLAVQNVQSKWTATACDGRKIVCNDQVANVSLRNPTKAVLAATVTHLTGLVPIRVREIEGTSSNWLWSVGDSPFSDTSLSAAHVSAFQRDAAHRHVIALALDKAVRDVNGGLALLANASVLVATKSKGDEMTWQGLLSTYAALQKLVQKIRGGGDDGEKANRISLRSALQLLPELREKAEGFHANCHWLAKDIKTASCREGETNVATFRRLIVTRWPAIIAWSVPFSVFLLLLLLISRHVYFRRLSHDALFLPN